MAGSIWEFFGHPVTPDSDPLSYAAAAKKGNCPVIGKACEKRLSDGKVAGVCSVKPVTSAPVICCPIRLYFDDYKILRDITNEAFEEALPLVSGKEAITQAKRQQKGCVAVFGKGWGGELRIPQKDGKGGYFVDWVLAKISPQGQLVEFVAVEVQTIDTTGSYRAGITSLAAGQGNTKCTVGLNWENVSKRILPQLIYKGQILQREALCKKGLYFVCPQPVYERIVKRLGGGENLITYALQPASITFLAYDYDTTQTPEATHNLKQSVRHSTTVYKVQEAFNNVTLPDENVFRDAILAALN